MYQLTLHCNKLITTVTWWTECWSLCILEVVFFICLLRWKSVCCNANWSIVSCVAILWETLTKGMKHNQSGFYLSFQGGRGFFSLDVKDLSSRRVWLHGLQPKNLKMFMPEFVFWRDIGKVTWYPAKLSGVAVKVHRPIALTNNPKFINQSCYWAKIFRKNAPDHNKPDSHNGVDSVINLRTHALVEEQMLSSGCQPSFLK